MKFRETGFVLTASMLLGTSAFAATLEPAPVRDSNIVLKITSEGSVLPPAPGVNNLQSPVVIDDQLYIVDQTGAILRQTAAGFETALSSGALPEGITAGADETIINIAGRGSHVYVGFTSSTLPPSLSDVAPLPSDPVYQSTGVSYQVIYSYDRAPDGALSNPQAVTAFESATVGHSGGGMLVLDDGDLVVARGDNLRFNRDGLSAPQDDADDATGVSRILIIDKETGAVTTAAKGVRNVQRMIFTDAAQTQIAFTDIGTETAEEVNVISVEDLRDTSEIENFGWGRNADGNAREGTFYISQGQTAVPGTRPVAIGEAPLGEAGFIQPYAQFGREGLPGFFAISGPIVSDVSFIQIDMLFGDLVNGLLFATLEPSGDLLNGVYRIALMDDAGNPVTLLDLSGGSRPDPRFFNFADGGAGVLLEGQGTLFRLTEVAVVPLPASGLLLLGGLVLLAQRGSKCRTLP